MLKRPKTGQQICRECFFYVFETEVHNTITEAKLFKSGDKVAIGASGGKGMRPALNRLQSYERIFCSLRFDCPCACHEDFERAI